MALRNIINMPSAESCFYQPPFSSTTSTAIIKPMATLIKPQSSMSSSSSTSSSGSSSIQIRTSSPISSSSSNGSSDCSSGPVNISPSKFLNAVHLSRKTSTNIQQQQQQQAPQTHQQMKHYVSIKQLAYEKLRRQQAIENDLYEHFNFSNIAQINSSELKMRSMGKIKLSIYNNLTHLTCHIVESRSLKLAQSHQQQQATYVKISIVPDYQKSFSNIRTQLIKPFLSQSNNKLTYLYDSKFSFESCQLTDPSMRIVISLWTQQEQLIGALSFKLKHLSDSHKPKYVWYHLLPLKYGLNKHLKCSVKSSHKSSEPKLTNVNKDLIHMDKMQYTVQKLNEQDSYGFTVTAGCPCMIGKVDLDKVAFRCGLRPGDFISRINGTNVSRASCESVVKMIKSSKFKLTIEVYREKTSDVYTPIQNYQFVRPVLSYQANVQQQQQQQQVQLESVPEEDEIDYEEEENDDDDLVFEEDEDYEEYEEDEEMRVGKLEDDNNYFKVIQNSIRFVDSVSSSEIINETTEQEPIGDENDAERLRRVAAQYYSNNQVSRQANIRMLKPTTQQ